MTRRLLVTGSRSWTNREIIRQTLLQIYIRMGGGVVLVHGDAVGADQLCRDIWREAGLPDEAHRPNWRPNGIFDPRAGFDRNALMVSRGAHQAAAFDLPCTDSRCRRKEPHITHGTEHCIRLIEHAQIPLWRWSRSLK